MMNTSLLRDFVTKYQDLFETLESSISEMSRSIPDLVRSTAGKKSVTEAVKLRNLGNYSYAQEENMAALKLYCKSIASAPDNSEELALAFGNRSAVLLRLRKPELSLLDVNRALKGRFPKCKKQKLLDRRAECWAQIQNKEKKNSGKVIILPTDVETKKWDFTQLCIDDSDLDIGSTLNDDPIWFTEFDNPLIPSFSSKVKLECNSTWGRHWVAAEDIKPGEILAIENIYIRASSKTLYEHCSHCSVWCEALIPCRTCSLQMYCGERCRQEAYDSYHRTECKVLPLIPLDCDNILLVLRIFLIGTKQGSEVASLMNDPNVYLSLEGKRSCVGVPYADDYLLILNLLWDIDDHSDFTLTSFQYYITVTLFVTLKRVNFFENGSNVSTVSRSFKDTELFVAFLLYHHFALARQYCGILFAEFVGNHVSEYRKEEIGCAISSYQSYQNHSCHANSFLLKNKRRQLTFSLKPIKAGEQIFTTYGYDYAQRKRADRRAFLKRNFRMVCQCKACIEDWPQKIDLLERKNIFITSKRSIIKKVEKMHKRLLKLVDSGENLKTHEETERFLTEILEFLKNIRKYVREPSPTILLCERFIQESMMEKGNYYSLCDD